MAIQKGKEFERETAALAGRFGKRIPRSGAIGTIEGIPRLAGDARWDFPWMNKFIAIECKHGYGTKGSDKSKSMNIKREWFDKHLKDAKRFDFYPAFAMKLKFTAENGLSKFMLIPFPVMERMIKEMSDLYLENCELRDEAKKKK